MKPAEIVKTIQIRSDPEGAVIEMDGDMLGPTPIELTVDITNDGSWKTLRQFDIARIFKCQWADGYQEQKSYLINKRVPDCIYFIRPKINQ